MFGSKTAGVEIHTLLQWSTYKKWHMGYQMVTCQMTPTVVTILPACRSTGGPEEVARGREFFRVVLCRKIYITIKDKKYFRL